MRYSKLLAVAAFGVSSVINPGYFAGCASSDDEHDADSNQAMTAEMTERVLAANSSYELNINAMDYRIDVDIEPVRAGAKQALNFGSAFAQTAYACGTQKLMATAAACITEYQMDVTGHIALLRKGSGDNYTEVASEVAVTGTLSSFGSLSLKFDGGNIELQGQLGAEYSFNLGAYELQTLVAK